MTGFKSDSTNESPLNILMVGTGEYTTGYVHQAASTSDKAAGVVAISLFELRRQGLVNDVKMAGTNGQKLPQIRQHLRDVIGDVYSDMDVSLQTWPPDDVEKDSEAYLAALDSMNPGDVVTVFTPDDTHFQIAMEAVQRKLHVLIAKPIVQTLKQHLEILDAAKRNNVLVAMEVHKRWDPIYADARDRIQALGDFSFFQSYMSQPKSQLDTFRSWAGRSSDISYYLNAHHIDFCQWAVGSFARPVSIKASAATGVAQSKGLNTEDTITLLVDWENFNSGNRGIAIYTSSWIAPKSDVHSQQRFFYMGQGGEITIDQAHRGYSTATDQAGFASANPLFMKYTPDAKGRFVGQRGYGFLSIEAFVRAAREMNSQQSNAESFRHQLALVEDTIVTTAILEAGRRSLDQDGCLVEFEFDEAGSIIGFK
jgi:D-galacturonate reductase